MATLLELCKIKHHAVRSDGAKFLDGVRYDSLDTSWLTVNSAGQVTLGPGLYDELLVVKGEVSDEQITTWAAMGAPFYDPAGNVVFEGTGGRIEIDKHGLKAIRNADGKVMYHFDIETGDSVQSGRVEAEEGYFKGELEIGGEGEEAPFRVTSDGELIATGVNVKGTIQSEDQDGNYSLLTAGRLSFHEVDPATGNQEQWQYISKVVAGTAKNGEYVNLDFDSPPAILLSPHTMPVVTGTNAKIETYATDVSRTGFRAWARVILPPQVDPSTVDDPMENTGILSGQNWISPNTVEPAKTMDVSIWIWLYTRIWYDTTVTGRINWKLEYQRSGGSWQTAGEWVDEASVTRGSPKLFETKKYAVVRKNLKLSKQIVFPTESVYRIRLSHTGQFFPSWFYPPGYPPEVKEMVVMIKDYTYSAVITQVLGTGKASYIAIEGGQ